MKKFMRNNTHRKIVAAVFAFSFFVVSAKAFHRAKPARAKQSPQTKQEKKRKGKLKMKTAKFVAVAAGEWGAAGVNLIVEETGVKIQYDCAEAEINEKLLIDEQGVFSVEGVYTPRYPGALRVNLPSKRQPARFEGVIADDKMTLRVALAATGETLLEEIVLRRGATPPIRRCY